MLIKTFKLFRRHPKKTIFFGALFGYGINLGKKRYQEECLMRAYCEEALKYGEVSHQLTEEERHVTVILNPAANNGKGKTKYEKYCAPLLHLAGLKVALVKTEHEDQARQIMDVMDNTSAVVVAGGDGTLSEILTGLLRREDSKVASRRFPLGVLPLGQSNTVASSIWHFNKTPDVLHLAEATMAVIKNLRRNLDVIEITPIEESDGSLKKPVYAAGLLEWGAFRDARERQTHYWYWGFLKKYTTYIFSSYKDLSWNLSANVTYSLPCRGCSTCVQKKEEEDIEAFQKRPKRWWEAFIPRPKNAFSQEKRVDYSSIINEECGKERYVNVEKVSDLRILSNNTPCTTDKEGHVLTLLLGESDPSTTHFIRESWRREDGETPSVEQEINFGELTLHPCDEAKKNKKDEDRKFYIDNETFEVRSMKIRPKPKAVTIFAPLKIDGSLS